MNTQYETFLHHVLHHGKPKADRTGTGTRSVFGYQMRFDLQEGFPLITTKRVHFKSVVAELLWFLSGSTNNNDLEAMGCTIWREWMRPDGDLGPIYGKQFRNWGGGIDQIANLVEGIKRDPSSRRHVVSAWNPTDIPHMALAPCHCLFQMDVTDGVLSCQLYQRSADIFLGIPFNIASYAMLCHMSAQQADLEVGDLIWVGGDVHLYKNHIEQAELQLSRGPKPLPTLKLNKAASMFDYKFEDFGIVGYDSWGAIKAEVAV